MGCGSVRVQIQYLYTACDTACVGNRFPFVIINVSSIAVVSVCVCVCMHWLY